MELTLNVGLKKSAKFVPHLSELLQVSTVVNTLDAYGLDVMAYRIVQSATEPTMVLLAAYQSTLEWREALYNVAEVLRQDCIAAKVGDEGVLVGPYSSAWGEFNPEYFIDF